jgi:hypothetical protein
MTPKGFEPAIPTSERPLTYFLQRAATWFGMLLFHSSIILWRIEVVITGKKIHNLIEQASVSLITYVFRYYA